MSNPPRHLDDPAGGGEAVRITCRACGFEDDWEPDALARHLALVGGDQSWTGMTRHLRCRRFGCGSTDLEAAPAPRDGRGANMPRRIGRLDARLLDAALTVLDGAARRSRGRAVDTPETLLALLVVHRYARDRECVRRFWRLASRGDRTADEGLAEPLKAIRHRLTAGGWLPPDVLLDAPRTWPWDSPAPSGWIDPTRYAAEAD